MSATDRPAARNGVLGVLVALGLTLAALGVTAAASTQINPGGTETGVGAYVTEHALTYWTWHETSLTTVPAPVPVRASTTVGTPTVLPRGARTYTINAAVAGDAAVAWTFYETTAAPRASEIAITFTDGLTAPVTSVTIYVETSFRAPIATVAYVFYWDAGTFAPGSLVVETMTTTAVACTAIGTCP